MCEQPPVPIKIITLACFPEFLFVPDFCLNIHFFPLYLHCSLFQAGKGFLLISYFVLYFTFFFPDIFCPLIILCIDCVVQCLILLLFILVLLAGDLISYLHKYNSVILHGILKNRSPVRNITFITPTDQENSEPRHYLFEFMVSQPDRIYV